MRQPYTWDIVAERILRVISSAAPTLDGDDMTV